MLARQACLLLGLLLSTFALMPEAEAACPNPAFGAIGGSRVQLISCTEAKSGSDVSNINLGVPASVALGDLLVAVITTDGQEVMNATAGWSLLTQATMNNNDGTLAVYTRVSNGAEPANYTFSWGSTEQVYSYMMRFTGASGQILFNSLSGNAGNTNSPAINTTVDHTMIVRLAGWDDDDLANDPANIITTSSPAQTHINITQDESNTGGGTVMGAAAYRNQPVAGSSGTATFAAGSEEWATITLGIEPIEFRFTTESGAIGTSSVCGVEQITLSVTDRFGTAMTWFRGTVTLSTTNNTGALWSYSGVGLTPGVNGAATFTYQASNIGTVALTYYNPNIATGVDFSVTFGNFIESSSPGYTPASLNVVGCRFVVSYQAGNSTSVCTIEAVTISLQDTAGNPATRYTGTLTIDNGSGLSYGNYTLNTGNAPSFSDATPNDGRATYAFAITPASPVGSNEVVVNYLHNSGSLTAINFATTENSGLGIIAAPGNPALTVLDCEFVVTFQPGNTVGTCGMEEVTISLQDTAGNPATTYASTLTINNGSGGTFGNYTLNTGNAPDFNDATPDDGQATYAFAITPASPPGSHQVILNYIHDSPDLTDRHFTISEGSGLTITHAGDPTLTIVACEIRITYPGVTPGVDGIGGTCAPSQVTIEVVNELGTPIVGYSGTIVISTTGVTDGIWTQSVVTGNLVGGGANDGSATYTFDPAENGSKTLNFFSATTGTYDFNIAQSGTPVLVTPPAGVYDFDLVLSPCQLVVTLPDADTTRDVCTYTRVQFEIQVGGSPFTSFNGLLNLATSAGQGLWYENPLETYGNSLTGGTVGDGTASYQFDGSEGGVVIFDFRNAVTATGLTFLATSSGIAIDATPPSIDIAQCTLTITTTNATVGNLADVCRGGEQVTYTLRDRDGAAAVRYNGTMVLQTSTSKGNYVKTGGAGIFSGPGGDDGFATYEFNPSDDGVLVVDYSVLAKPAGPGTVTLTASITNVTLVNTDGTFTYRNCQFKISFPADTAPFETDVCSIKQVQIRLEDFDNDPVDNYTGTINLTTTTGFGSWALSSTANGILNDPFGEDGAASYTFNDDGIGADDNGVVILNFTHTADDAAALNINVSDSITTDPGNPGSADDPVLLVDLCSVQISFDGGGIGSLHADEAITACSVQQVTIEIFDSTGAIASDYTGQINITTSTNNGNWAIGTGNGSLSNVVVDGGAVSYTFFDDGPGGGTDDDGVVTLDFSNLNAETVNFNVVDEVIALALDGVIVEEGTADPDLEIGSCLPAVESFNCSTGGNGITAALTIDAQNATPALRGRMVVVATSHEGNASVTNATFGGINMFLLKDLRADEGGNDSNTTLWAIDDATMPSGGGSFDAVITHGDTSLSVCAMYVNNAEQVYPAENLVTPQNGTLNSTSSTDNTPVSSVTVTTTQNNALIISVAGNGGSGSYSAVSPTPPITRLFNVNPAGAVFGGSSGNASTAAAITVDETASNPSTLRHTHIVAAFNPLISGPPVAQGYVPVTLFKTYSGNISYRAVGASFQTSANGVNTCNITNTATATLTLPDVPDGVLSTSGDPFSAPGEFDSDIRAAWLYWFASGSHDLPNMDGVGNFPNTLDPNDFANVTLTSPDGLGGFNVTNIPAAEIFQVENVGSNSNADYYVGYADVTEIMVGSNNEGTGSDEDPNGNYTLTNLEIDSGEPWLGRGSCAGGFSLIVIYENPYEQLRVMNLFHGFQPFQNSAFTLVPRNFRIAARDTDTNSPNGQVTHITVEGDAGISGTNEALTIQDDPLDFNPATFNPLFTDFNPQGEEFNGTVTRPVYSLTDVVPGGAGTTDEYVYIFNSASGGGGNPSNGYELDFPNPAIFPFTPPGPALTTYGLSYGVDIDTHFIDGDNLGDILYNFADLTNLAEEITTRYAADQDLVLLVAEIISVSNAPIADIEVTITEADPQYKVNSTGTYNIEVRNNGNGASSFGTATGFIELVGELPAGMTFTGIAPITGTGWDCTDFSASAFTCTYDIPASPGLGDASLPIVSATVTIAAPPASFPSLNNDAKVIVRVQHSDGTCLGGSTGILPIPTDLCEAPEFDNVNDLQGGAIDINDLDDKTGSNNNVHSVTTNVKGIETNLSVSKVVTTALVEDSENTVLYTITVTNNGPDDIVPSLTQPAITIIDNEPAGINFDSANGTNWDCTVNEVPNPDQLVCTFDNTLIGSIPSGGSSIISIIGDVTGVSPASVTNTVQVSPGTYNFDVVTPNTGFVTANITPPPAAVTDRFLLSVSAAAAANTTSLGSGGGLLSNFTDDDIVLYDPLTDAAELFIDSQTTPGYNVTDPDAIHLLPNGQVVMSANADGNSLGVGTSVNFDKEDLVLYDRLLNTATLFFDGSIIVDDPMDAIDLNIDAVYVLYDGSFIFSTAGPAGDGGIVNWSDSDLVLYDGVNFSIYLDAEDDNVFGNIVDAQVDAFYLRVDPTDATAVLDTFVMSSAVQGSVLGDNTVTVGRDDVAEVTIDTGSRPSPTATTATNLFNGGVPIGVFDTMEPDLKINALHIIEPAHLGHFEITESQAGNACEPGKIRIRKHLGTSHGTDTNYTGSIIISTDTLDGIWSVDVGTPANLNNNYGGDPDNGQALYTFAPGDNGEVILSLNVVQDPPAIDTVGVSVTNGFVVDEDNSGPYNFNFVVTDVTYRDEFAIAAFDNDDGTAGWSIDWAEVDGFNGISPTSGAGMATGNIQMVAGKLRMKSNSNTNGSSIDPSMTRAAALGLFTQSEPILIRYDYEYTSVTNSGDVFLVQISSDDSSYVTVKTYNTLNGSSGSPVSEVIDLSGIPAAAPVLAAIDDMNPNLYVRLVITQGYVLGTFIVDNFEVATGTTACNITAFDHYDIFIPESGLACIASTVRIEGHDFQHNLSSPGTGTVLTLTTSNGAGTWASILTGSGTLLDIGGLSDTDGQATYTLNTDEEFIELAFNYTDPAGDGAVVNINVTDGGGALEIQDLAHDPNATFDEVGILFFDEAGGSTALPFQIAGKPALTAPASGNVTLQLVRSVPIGGENPAAACESLVDDGDIVTLKLAGLCVNPAGCDVSTMSVWDAANVEQTNVPVFSSPTANPEASGLALTLEFADQGTVSFGEANIGAPINFSYADAGKISLHAEYDIPFDNDIAGVQSGDTISGASQPFIVRPFGFDIDFSDDRASAGGLSLANDASGPAFARAGVGFNATVSAVTWETGDDLNADGIPDFGADLSDNAVTTNFGDESPDPNTVLVSVVTDDPNLPGVDDNPGVPGGELGNIVLGDIFQSFTSGVSGPQLIAIDEVGIFDLSAQLIDNNVDRNAVNYFDETPYTAVEGISGGVANVGRIYPNHFELVSSSFGPRVNQAMACAMSSTFTYMGEDFGLNLTLAAKNGLGNTTLNYRDTFAKLASFSELDIRAIVDNTGAADTDRSSRLVNSSVPATFGGSWVAGEISLSGDMNLSRQPGGAEDGPLVGVQIALGPIDDNDDGIFAPITGVSAGADNDVLLDVFDVDLDDGLTEPGTNVLKLFSGGTHEFRYGRLLIDNAFGPETEPLNIPLRVEYFNGSEFVVNTDDSCTAFLFDIATPALTFVPTSYEAFDIGNPFADGDTEIEQGEVLDVTISLFEGQTRRLADSDGIESNDTDRPFITSAPANEEIGRVLVEFDLDGASLPTSLDFLKYDWRGGVGEADDYDEVPEGSGYDDNPRGVVEFGSYRGHDRVINWQEIFIGPGGI